jgi:hypothetical protein
MGLKRKETILSVQKSFQKFPKHEREFAVNRVNIMSTMRLELALFFLKAVINFSGHIALM